MKGEIEMEHHKQTRLLELFLRSLRGEPLHLSKLAEHFGCTPRSMTRDMNDLKAFLSEHQDICGKIEYVYDYGKRCYYLKMNDFLTSQELYSILEVLIGARAFGKDTLMRLYDKIKGFTTPSDRSFISDLVHKELKHYQEVKHRSEEVIEMVWDLSIYVQEKREITIDYYKMDQSFVTRRVVPLAVLFQDYYFYMVAYKCDDVKKEPRFFRVDRIENIIVHRQKKDAYPHSFDEGVLRNQNLYMWPGPKRYIQFEFRGPSLQAVLDRLPNSKVLKKLGDNAYLIESSVQGDGIMMWLLSQRSWVKVIAPTDFVETFKAELKSMLALYD